MASKRAATGARGRRAFLLASLIMGLTFGLVVAAVQVRLNHRRKTDCREGETKRWLAEEQAKELDPEYQDYLRVRVRHEGRGRDRLD